MQDPIRIQGPWQGCPRSLCPVWKWIFVAALPLPSHSCCTYRVPGKLSLDSRSCAGYLELAWAARPSPLHKDVKNLLSCTPLPVVPSRGGGSGARIAPVPLPELQQEVAPQPAWPGAVGSPFPKGGLVENMLMGLLQPSPGVCGSSCFNCRILYIFKGELL